MMSGYAWGAAECSNACLFTQNTQHSPAEADLPLIFNQEGASEVLLLPQRLTVPSTQSGFLHL